MERRRGADALAVCERCPGREACLAYAADDETVVGVWGGTTTAERRAMRAAA